MNYAFVVTALLLAPAAIAADSSPTNLCDSALVPLQRVEPKYPIVELNQPSKGFATLRFVVSMEGAPVQAKVVAEDPPHFFGAAALRAVRQWRYPPQPQACVVEATFRFELTE